MQQGVPWRGKWIDDRHSAPREAFVKVLGQKQTTTGLRRGGQDDSIPYSQLVIRREIGRRQHNLGRRFRNGERIAPTQQGIPGVASRLSAFADEHVEKLAQNLYRNDGSLLRQY